MKCKACDALLSEEDIKRKDKITREYLDLCQECYLHSQEAIMDYESFVTGLVEEEQ